MSDIELAPDPHLLESMRSVGYSFETSVADIVDNSIGANATRIDILASADGPFRFAVLDDGSGMTRHEAIDAMTLAARSPSEERSKSDLGRFGLGLKTASLAQCRRLSVVTKREGVMTAFRWDLDHVLSSKRWLLQELDVNKCRDVFGWDLLDALPHGTLVCWDELDLLGLAEGTLQSDFDSAVRRVQSHCELVFHRFVSGNDVRRIEITVNGTPLTTLDPFLRSNRATRRQSQSVYVSGVELGVTSYTLPFASKLSAAERARALAPGAFRDSQGFYIYRGGTRLPRPSADRTGAIAVHRRIDVPVPRAALPSNMTKLWAYGVDVALCALAVVVLATSLHDPAEHVRYGAALMTVALLVLLGRSWHPPVASIAGFAVIAAGGRITPQISAVMFLAVLASFAVAGTAVRRWSAVAGWAAGCAAMLVSMLGNPYVDGAGDVILTLTFCTVIWAAAMAAAEWSRQAGRAHAHAEFVTATRDHDVALATSHERSRIAGELHDVVSHGLSIVILQTVAARIALHDEGDPVDATDRRLDVVEATARNALDDMRRLLELLRTTDVGASGDEITPSAGLDQVPLLAEQGRLAGLDLRLSDDRRGRALPSGLDAAAYRIVQDHQRHQARARCRDHRAHSVRRCAARGRGGQHRRRIGCARVRAGRCRVRADRHASADPVVRRNLRRRTAGGRFCSACGLPAGRPDMISVLLADDQALVRDGFRAIIDREPDLRVVAEAADGVEAVALDRRLRPDVVLMDIRMPRLDGLTATRRLLDRPEPARVLVLTTFDRNDWVYEALRAGASGFLLKDVRASQLTDAIRTVAAGETMLAPAITGRLIEDYLARNGPPAPDPRAGALSQREREVLRRIALGQSNAEIAAHLYVGVSTVKTYVNRLLTKLDLRDRTQAAIFAYEHGVVAPGHSQQG